MRHKSKQVDTDGQGLLELRRGVAGKQVRFQVSLESINT